MSEDPAVRLREFSEDERVDSDQLAEALLDYDARPDKPASFSGITPTANFVQSLAKTLRNVEVLENALQERAQRTIDRVRGGSMRPRERREMLGSALRDLLKFTSRNERGSRTIKDVTRTMIAEAYLLRSIFFRPRGFGVPAKKEEAIEKGLKIFGDEPKGPDARRVKALLILEQEKIVAQSNTLQELDNAVQLLWIDRRLKDNRQTPSGIVPNDDEHRKEREDIAIAIRYCELVNDKDKCNPYLQYIVNSQLEGISFEKARAYHLHGDADGVIREMAQVADILGSQKRYYFSNPLWTEVVDFIKRLWENGAPYWGEIAKSICKACEDRVRRTKNVYLRLHWSGLRDLYDLAFLAESTLEEKARIANALKDRPAQRRNIWAEDPDAELQEDDDSYNQRFLGGLADDNIDHRSESERPVDFNTLTGNWIAIHFYLNHLEGNGYALIHDGTTKTWKCPALFKFDALFKSFLEWQENYSRSGMRAAGQLVELCKVIGQTMPFLFDDKIIPKDRSVVFIPHDFLRRLPLHGAISANDERVFLEDHPCTYLPYWKNADSSDEIKTDGKYVFKNWEEGGQHTDLIKKVWESGGTVFDPASKEDVADKDKMRENPEYAIFLCHGRANGVNPFKSKLKLQPPGLTYRDLRGMGKKFTGSRIFLGACETDLLPSLQSPLDEHLTISGAFFDQGAKEIVGTMWIVPPENVQQAFLEVYSDNASAYSLWKWQKTQVDLWKEKDRDSIIFFDFISVRLVSNIFASSR